MDNLTIAREYLKAWNAHGADAIVSTFAADGTYCDPSTDVLSGEAIGANAKRRWKVYPDLSFEMVSIAEAGPGKVVGEWIMKGTKAEAFQEDPGAGQTISVPRVDVISIGENGIQSVKGYFDTAAFPKPSRRGVFEFGTTMAVSSGKKVRPGAVCVTTIFGSEEEQPEIGRVSIAIAKSMLKMDGFIHAKLTLLGDRNVTNSFWVNPKDPQQLMSGGPHGKAMERFSRDLGRGGFTAVYALDHINPMRVRCTACDQMTYAETSSGVCTCGEPLPEAPAYF